MYNQRQLAQLADHDTIISVHIIACEKRGVFPAKSHRMGAHWAHGNFLTAKKGPSIATKLLI